MAVKKYHCLFKTGVNPNDQIFVVGDIHGHYLHLLEVFLAFEHSMGKQRRIYVFLGDLINKGPESLRCLDFALELSQTETVVVLQGNHEQALRLLLKNGKLPDNHYWEHYSGLDILTDLGRGNLDFSSEGYLKKTLRIALGDQRGEFLESLHSHAWFGNILFVHGNVSDADLLREGYWLNWDSIESTHWCWATGTSNPEFNGKSDYFICHGHIPILENFDTARDNSSLPKCFHSKNRICLDGGNFLGGSTMGCVFTSEGITLISSS